MREEILANRMALEQLGHYRDDELESEEDYEQRLFQARVRRGSYGQVVDDLAKRVANVALSNRDTESKVRRFHRNDGLSIWGKIKELPEKPWVRESMLIGGIAIFKMALYFAYRRAAAEGIPEIADL